MRNGDLLLADFASSVFVPKNATYCGMDLRKLTTLSLAQAEESFWNWDSGGYSKLVSFNIRL